MLKISSLFYPFKYCFLLLAGIVYSQTQIYKTDIAFAQPQQGDVRGSILLAEKNVVFAAGNYTIYSIEKKNPKILWEKKVGWKSDTPIYTYNDTFFFGKYDGESRNTMQFDVNSGEEMMKLSVESIHTKPYFANGVMYTTALSDGGKLIAYDLNKNEIIWQKNIGHGFDLQPIYQKDKIIANLQAEGWVEINYQGQFINSKSDKNSSYIDDEKINLKKCSFLTHDGEEVTIDFLRKNKIDTEEYDVEKTDQNTFILDDRFLTILGKNTRVKYQLNLETIVSPEEYENETLSAIVNVNSETLWFVFQNHLIHYDFKKKKLLRNVYLNNWYPHKLILDGRTIWLISKNDGQLYALDFEPDASLDMKIKIEKAKQDRLRCEFPDRDKIKAQKAAESQMIIDKNQ